MRALAVFALLFMAACSPGGSGTTPSGGQPTSPAASSPASGVACIDRADLADIADVSLTVLQSVSTDLKVPDVTKAKADAGSAVTGLGKLADLVGPVRADAAQDFRTAATELTSAISQFPGGQPLVDKALADFNSGLDAANAAQCPA
jgi:hypothetical protein